MYVLKYKISFFFVLFFLSDSAAQTSKQGDGTAADQDASIDEILGLQVIIVCIIAGLWVRQILHIGVFLYVS